MSISVGYAGASILQGIQPESIECAQLADMGETATGAFTVEDDAADLTIIGYQPVTISESACSQPRLFTGWTFERGYQRDPPNAILTEEARTHDVSVIDMNGAFGFRQITRTGTGGGNRPAETWAARLTWILESEYLRDWISSDQSFVVTNTTACDAADYRGSYPSAVLQDLSERSGNAYDYFAFWDPAAQEVRLFFDNDTASIGDSALRISTILSEWDGLTTFGPDKLAKLQRESDQVYSDVCVNYADGTLKLYRSRPSTYRTYVRRSTQIDRPYTRSEATATLQAEAWLDKHAVEKDRVTCTIRVPASRAGLVQAGQRIQFKAPHMPGYADYVWMRVVMCTPKPADETVTLYDIALELTTPVPVVEPPCPDPTPDSVWYPTGSATSDADGNVMYQTTGVGNYLATPYNVGAWNFPVFGAGAGDDRQGGRLRGEHTSDRDDGGGTLTIVTVAGTGHACPLQVVRYTVQSNTARTADGPPGDFGVAGDTFVVAIPDQVDCDYHIELQDYNPALLDPPARRTSAGRTGAGRARRGFQAKRMR